MARNDEERQPQSSGNPEEDFTLLQSLAERLGLDEKQADSFISSSMKRFGYRPRTSWEPPENEDNGGKGDGDFFGGGNREQRRVRDDRQQQRGGGGGNSGGGSGWQYD